MSDRLWVPRALSALALIAALIGTASAEYSLASAVGFSAALAWCIPASLDVYSLAAFSLRRDVPGAVGALVVTNALAHLVTSRHLAASVPLVIAVSAIPPAVLWRTHVLSGYEEPVSAPDSSQEEPQAPEEPTPAPKPAESRPAPQPAKPADPLLPDARAFADEVRSRTGRAPSLRALQAHLRIGQARAQRIRAQLAA